MTARRSGIGGDLEAVDLATVLRLSTMLRSRRQDGRFGAWESRTAPSAGGIHGVSLVALPLGSGPLGLYDDAKHRLLHPEDDAAVRERNRASVAMLCGATAGTTVQLVADASRYAACYDDHDSLMWRDAGALLAVLSLVSTSLGLRSVILGREGGRVVEVLDVPRWTAVGAIHLGS